MAGFVRQIVDAIESGMAFLWANFSIVYVPGGIASRSLRMVCSLKPVTR